MTCRASRRLCGSSPATRFSFTPTASREAWGPTDMFGYERLVAAMMRSDRRGTEILDGILEEMAAFTGSKVHQDDVTLLTLDLA